MMTNLPVFFKLAAATQNPNATTGYQPFQNPNAATGYQPFSHQWNPNAAAGYQPFLDEWNPNAATGYQPFPNPNAATGYQPFLDEWNPNAATGYQLFPNAAAGYQPFPNEWNSNAAAGYQPFSHQWNSNAFSNNESLKRNATDEDANETYKLFLLTIKNNPHFMKRFINKSVDRQVRKLKKFSDIMKNTTEISEYKVKLLNIFGILSSLRIRTLRDMISTDKGKNYSLEDVFDMLANFAEPNFDSNTLMTEDEQCLYNDLLEITVRNSFNPEDIVLGSCTSEDLPISIEWFVSIYNNEKNNFHRNQEAHNIKQRFEEYLKNSMDHLNKMMILTYFVIKRTFNISSPIRLN